jgi:glycosyltransferase involved in cell wall biosynthesis
MTQTAEHEAVTVVIPTRGRPAIVCQAVRSVLAQERVSVHVVVVVDGADDETVDALAALPTGSVEVVVKAREGVSAARNTGMASARTRWVALLDDDDLWAPSKLAEQLALVTETGAGGCVTSMVTFAASTMTPIALVEPPCDNEIARAILMRNVLAGAPSSLLIDRDVLSTVGPFDSALNAAEDWDFMIRLAQTSPLAVVRRPVVAYRVWSGSVSFDTDVMERASRLVLERHADAREAEGVEVDWGAIERYLARQDARAGRRIRASRRFLRAFAQDLTLRDLARAGASSLLPRLVAKRMDHGSRRQLSIETRQLFDRWYLPQLEQRGAASQG